MLADRQCFKIFCLQFNNRTALTDCIILAVNFFIIHQNASEICKCCIGFEIQCILLTFLPCSVFAFNDFRRKFRKNRVLCFNFMLCIRITEKFITIFAVPIFRIAIFCSCRRLCICLYQMPVICRIDVAIRIPANFTYCFFLAISVSSVPTSSANAADGMSDKTIHTVSMRLNIFLFVTCPPLPYYLLYLKRKTCTSYFSVQKRAFYHIKWVFAGDCFAYLQIHYHRAYNKLHNKTAFVSLLSNECCFNMYFSLS